MPEMFIGLAGSASESVELKLATTRPIICTFPACFSVVSKTTILVTLLCTYLPLYKGQPTRFVPPGVLMHTNLKKDVEEKFTRWV